MLTSRIYKHHPDEQVLQVITKRIQINELSTLYFQIFAEQSAVIALVESQIVELCSDYQLRKESEDIFFTKLLSWLNRLISSQSNAFSKSGMRAFLGIIRGPELLFSVCGNYQAYLQQEDSIINIADGMSSGIMEFSYVSSGSILPGNSLFVCNRDLLSFLTSEDLEEFSLDHDPSIIENLISREATHEVVDCLLFFYDDKSVADPLKRFARTGPSFLETARDLIAQGYQSLNESIKALHLKERYETFISHPKIQSFIKKKEVRIGMFGLGIGVALVLLMLIIRSVFYTSMVTAVPEEYKLKLIEAEQIIGRSTRDMANRELFKQNLSKAESLIFEVRDKKMFANDVKSLLEKISVLKRQLNAIESIDLENRPVDFSLPEGTDPVTLLEHTKKFYVVAKKGVYGPFVKGNETKFSPYPDKELAKSADITPEGNIMILTENNKILRFAKWEFNYMNVEWQTTWQMSSSIKAFIGNIYLLSEDGKQIFRHRPSIVGFSAKMPMIDGSPLIGKNLLDFTIDGGFYVLQSDLTLEKYTTSPSFSRAGVVLNKLPDNYGISSDTPAKIFSTSSSNFVYMLIDGRVLIFEPDSKVFKNVRNLKYVGQIEVTGHDIQSILAPKDGEINVVTQKWISNIKFEISDSKIILR